MNEFEKRKLTQADFLPKIPEEEGKRTGIMPAIISAGLLFLALALNHLEYIFNIDDTVLSTIIYVFAFILGLIASTLSLIAAVLAFVSLRRMGASAKAVCALILGGLTLAAANAVKFLPMLL